MLYRQRFEYAIGQALIRQLGSGATTTPVGRDIIALASPTWEVCKRSGMPAKVGAAMVVDEALRMMETSDEIPDPQDLVQIMEAGAEVGALGAYLSRGESVNAMQSIRRLRRLGMSYDWAAGQLQEMGIPIGAMPTREAFEAA